ncbi:ArsR/SmtB family transcription factor [Paraburkholderia solisilvae]|nr:helix-turn-helix transcriptional regulator [Paraburkholderia solisilvae]
MIDFDAAMRALAHPFRRQVLQWLADPATHFCEVEPSPIQGVSVGMLRARSGLSQSTVSAHLSQLERAGLIKAQKIGQWVFLSRNESAIREFAERLCGDIAKIDSRF